RLADGMFEVESRGATPFDAQGEKLAASFQYDRTGPRYRSTLAVDPLEVQVEDRKAIPIGANLALEVEKDRIALTSAKLTTGGTSMAFSGAIENLAAPHGKFTYDARVALADVARIFHVPELQRGEARLGGNAVWAGGSQISATGNLRASGVAYH